MSIPRFSIDRTSQLIGHAVAFSVHMLCVRLIQPSVVCSTLQLIVPDNAFTSPQRNKDIHIFQPLRQRVGTQNCIQEPLRRVALAKRRESRCETFENFCGLLARCLVDSEAGGGNSTLSAHCSCPN